MVVGITIAVAVGLALRRDPSPTSATGDKARVGECLLLRLGRERATQARLDCLELLPRDRGPVATGVALSVPQKHAGIEGITQDAMGPPRAQWPTTLANA